MENKLIGAENICIAEFETPPLSIGFSSPQTGDELGRFFEDEGKLKFEGNLDESGKIFVDFLIRSFSERVEFKKK